MIVTIARTSDNALDTCGTKRGPAHSSREPPGARRGSSEGADSEAHDALLAGVTQKSWNDARRELTGGELNGHQRDGEHDAGDGDRRRCHGTQEISRAVRSRLEKRWELSASLAERQIDLEHDASDRHRHAYKQGGYEEQAGACPFSADSQSI